MSLEQVAKVLGMTRERIRQIEVKALMRARTSDEAEELDPCFVPAATLTRRR
jgi:DNA-directed RNA polymerase sigma subunit (sigma70/sigma32)